MFNILYLFWKTNMVELLMEDTVMYFYRYVINGTPQSIPKILYFLHRFYFFDFFDYFDYYLHLQLYPIVRNPPVIDRLMCPIIQLSFGHLLGIVRVFFLVNGCLCRARLTFLCSAVLLLHLVMFLLFCLPTAFTLLQSPIAFAALQTCFLCPGMTIHAQQEEFNLVHLYFLIHSPRSPRTIYRLLIVALTFLQLSRVFV